MTNTISNWAQTHDLHLIDPPTLQEWLSQGPVTLVDVREPVEYAESHIPGAMNLPLSKLQPDQIPLQPGRKIVLYCRSGQRSNQACQRLTQLDQPLYQLQGGLGAWGSAGFQVKKNPKAPMSLFRQVQIVAGSLVVLGTVLGALVSPWFLVLSGFVGAGLVFAGVTNTCAMGMLLAKLPYNQRSHQTWEN